MADSTDLKERVEGLLLYGEALLTAESMTTLKAATEGLEALSGVSPDVWSITAVTHRAWLGEKFSEFKTDAERWLAGQDDIGRKRWKQKRPPP